MLYLCLPRSFLIDHTKILLRGHLVPRCLDKKTGSAQGHRFAVHSLDSYERCFGALLNFRDLITCFHPDRNRYITMLCLVSSCRYKLSGLFLSLLRYSPAMLDSCTTRTSRFNLKRVNEVHCFSMYKYQNSNPISRDGIRLNANSFKTGIFNQPLANDSVHVYTLIANPIFF